MQKRRFLIRTGYLLFLVVLVESVSRLAFVIPASARRLIVDEDLSWRRKWVARRTESVEIFYPFDRYDATKGWMTKPGLRDQVVFDRKILNTNSRGLRGRTEYRYEKPAGTTRILVIGDSFAFGDEVSDNETFAAYLQQMMPAAEILNMGVHGYGHDQMLILLKEEGCRYRPDIVILGYDPWDVSRNILTFRDYAKPAFVLKDGRLTPVNTPVPEPRTVLETDWRRPRMLDAFAVAAFHVGTVTGTRAARIDRTTTAILSEMTRTIADIQAVPVFVYLPVWPEMMNPAPTTKGEQFLFDVCRTESIRCFSTRAQYQNAIAEGRVRPRGGHWDPEGHRVVAESIFNYLVDAGALIDRTSGRLKIPCPQIPTTARADENCNDAPQRR